MISCSHFKLKSQNKLYTCSNFNEFGSFAFHSNSNGNRFSFVRWLFCGLVVQPHIKLLQGLFLFVAKKHKKRQATFIIMIHIVSRFSNLHRYTFCYAVIKLTLYIFDSIFIKKHVLPLSHWNGWNTDDMIPGYGRQRHGLTVHDFCFGAYRFEVLEPMAKF